MRRKTDGFTLIELLIVVAIIAILAAIAVPNFLEAQVRSKVSRSWADMRSIALAIESYKIDTNNYPPYTSSQGALKAHQRLNRLSTPIAYLSSVPEDPFAANTSHLDPVHWDYHHMAYMYWRISLPGQPGGNWGNSYSINEARARGARWGLAGRGPNRYFDNGSSTLGGQITLPANTDVRYDPSNGTVSWGDLERFGP